MSAYWGKYAGKLVIVTLMFSSFFFFNQETIKKSYSTSWVWVKVAGNC
jgi:hypothetical protein